MSRLGTVLKTAGHAQKADVECIADIDL
jgi:hypothetical protein